MKFSRVVQWVLGFCLAAAGMWIFLKNINGHDLLYQICHSNPVSIALCAILAIVSIWIRALRASILLPSCTRAQKKQLFPIVMISFMINNILPARMGEAARAMLMWKKNGYSGAVSIGSLVLERMLDMLVFLSCFFIPVFFTPQLSKINIQTPNFTLFKSLTLNYIAIGFCAIFFTAILFLVLYSRFPVMLKLWGNKAQGLLPKKVTAKIAKIANELISNLDWTFSFQKVLGVFVLSYGIVLCSAITTVILVAHPDFGVLKGLFAQAFAALGAAIPLSPGYVGTLHAVFFQGLSLCGIEKEKATAVTIFYHAIPYITVTSIGLFFFFRANISFKEISSAKKSMENEENKEVS